MNKKKKETILISSVVGFISYLFVILWYIHLALVMEENPKLEFIDALNLSFDDMFTRPFTIFPLPNDIFSKILLYTLLCGLLIFMFYVTQKGKAHYNVDKVQGDAAWMKSMDDYNKKFTDPIGKPTSNGPTNVILSQDMLLAMDNEATRRNLNVFVVGGSGVGKSYNYVGPNIMQANSSFVVTDPSGGLYKQYGHYLEYMGYNVKCFNLDHMDRGNHYNPFQYIENDQDIEILVNTLIKNTTPPDQKGGDPFWEKSETALLVALIAFLFHYTKKECQCFTNVMRLLRAAEVDENDSNAKSQLDRMFEDIEERYTDSFAAKQYRTFKMGAGKTLKSILISCAVRLQAFDLAPVAALTNTDDLDLDSVGDEKTALFVIIPTGDTTFQFLSSMMYSQLFQRLYRYSENTAEFSQCIMDEDKQIWKTFRAGSPEEVKRVRKEAEAFFERAKDGIIRKNVDYEWWEIRTNRNELVGYRGTKEEAEKALQKLRAGKVISNSEQSNSGQRLPIHVRMLLDEFANTGKIPQFSEKVATIRKYEISVNIIVQSLSQMKNLYKDDWETITGNCDNTVYLGGGADTVTTEWISKLLGKETRVVMNVNYSKGGGGQSFNRTGVELYTPSQLRTMPEDECIVIPKSLNALKGKKFASDKHPRRSLVKKLNKERGAYIFNSQKAADLLSEHKLNEEIITEKHGNKKEPDKAVYEAKNEAEQQKAEEYRNNMDVNGEPLVGKPQDVQGNGDGMDQTLPLQTAEEAAGSVEKTLDANDKVWGPDELMYTSVTPV